MKSLSIMVCGLSALMLTGCFGASHDPHQGGLFGYSPTAYQQRLAEREQNLSYYRNENQRLNEENVTLEKQRRQQASELAALQKKDKALRAEISSLDGKLNKAQASGNVDKAKLRDLRNRRQAASSKLATMNKQDIAGRERELARLQQELKALHEEADVLSKM